MPESRHISDQVAKLAAKLFPGFYWEQVGPTDQNTARVSQPEHNRTHSKTHPNDAVFRYRHPYTGKQTYIIFDYKSLSKDSISVSAMGGATKQIGNALDCAFHLDWNIPLWPRKNAIPHHTLE